MKFGIQRFLNPVDSSDSGFMKLSLRPRDHGMRRPKSKEIRYIGHSVTYQLADCGERIYLEFSYGDYVNIKNYSTDTDAVKEQLSDLRGKRKKMKGMMDAMNRFADRYYQALDTDEAALLQYLEDKKAYEEAKDA